MKTMTKVSTYLSFNGTCAEAFDQYADIFGGTVVMRITYADAPVPTPVADSEKHLVMHSALSIGSFQIMGTDMIGGRPYQAPQGVSVMVELDNAETVKTAFTRLAEGGQVMMPVEPTFWTDAFGMLTDRFGVRWMLNAPMKG
jgi:PhnB protein